MKSTHAKIFQIFFIYPLSSFTIFPLLLLFLFPLDAIFPNGGSEHLSTTCPGALQFQPSTLPPFGPFTFLVVLSLAHLRVVNNNDEEPFLS